MKFAIELWADSLHEGDWACRQLGVIAVAHGWEHHVTYVQGFIPKHVLKATDLEITITVYGSYNSWDPVPPIIAELLSWGKPDFVAYEPLERRILFAVEETAAVPTGNQALQRCERLYGSARTQIPFWYLLSEYGQHKDKGVRRDSIWPTVMALKLTHTKKVPCVVLHYSDIDHPENYSAGAGLASLFKALFQIIDNAARKKPFDSGMSSILEEQYLGMLTFLDSQWKNIVDYLPGYEHLATPAPLSKQFAAIAMQKWSGRTVAWPDKFLIWPKVSELPGEIRDRQKSKGLIKHDDLCEKFEHDAGAGTAYCLSDNAGSRPQPMDSLIVWIRDQKKLFDRAPQLKPPARFTIDLADFPTSESGNRHITTAKNIVYLYDRWADVRAAVEKVYPRLDGKLDLSCDEVPALVYLSNSIKPGRIFGDPFTGQIAAYATAFGKLDPRPRVVLVYFPHQAHTQAIPNAAASTNKGLTMMSELTDYLLFTGGVAVSMKTRTIL